MRRGFRPARTGTAQLHKAVARTQERMRYFRLRSVATGTPCAYGRERRERRRRGGNAHRADRGGDARVIDQLPQARCGTGVPRRRRARNVYRFVCDAVVPPDHEGPATAGDRAMHERRHADSPLGVT